MGGIKKFSGSGDTVARFNRGWIKAWRQAAESDLVDNLVVWGLWHWLLYAATWLPTKKLINGTQTELPPGTVVFSPKELAEIWGCSRSVIQKWLHYLHDTQRVVLTTSRRGTVVTICNWATYQGDDATAVMARTNGVGTACSPRDNCEALTEESKKGRKKEQAYSAEFEAAWEAFGKVGKKKDAAKAFEEEVSAERLPALLVAIAAYLADCRAKQRTQMYFATFVREDWSVWLERKAASGPKFMTLEEIEKLGGGNA